MDVKAEKDYYKEYLDALIEESKRLIDNGCLICPISLDNFMIDTRRRLLRERKHKELASMYQLLGMHYRNINNVFFDNYLTANYYANSLLIVSCYYYKYIHNEYAGLLAQLIAFSQERVINQFENIDSRFANEYAINIELLGDIYSLLDYDKASEYYNKAKQLYKGVDHYDQLSCSNDFWCSYAFTETSIALKECFNIELSLSETGIERIEQKNGLFKTIKNFSIV